MRITAIAQTSKRLFRRNLSLSVVACLALASGTARASIAYGSINNFDTVNDTSNVCHGFEIELDDIQTTDITYTYDYNHDGPLGGQHQGERRLALLGREELQGRGRAGDMLDDLVDPVDEPDKRGG